jgi:hypothetical protein
VHDTSGGEDESEDDIMHAPDASDLDDTDRNRASGNLLEHEESFSGNKRNDTQHSPEPTIPLPTPAESAPLSAPASPSMAAHDLPFAPENPSDDMPKTLEMTVGRGLPPIETDDDHQFSLDGPATRIGRKRKARDLPSILQVCTCGQTVQGDEKLSGEGVVQCKATGCETVWVSSENPSRLDWDSPS